jgi:hypothetical protein
METRIITVNVVLHPYQESVCLMIPEERVDKGVVSWHRDQGYLPSGQVNSTESCYRTEVNGIPSPFKGSDIGEEFRELTLPELPRTKVEGIDSTHVRADP